MCHNVGSSNTRNPGGRIMRTTKPSKTALVIAKSAVIASRDPRISQLQSPGAGEVSQWFVRDHAPDHRWLQTQWYRAALGRLESWILPGVQLHYAARKRLLEQHVEAALRDGAKQVVVIAGGFDTLCYRLHTSFSNVRFVELDHPATQASKRFSLERHGTIGTNLALHPVDLTSTPLTEALRDADVDPARSTIVVAEGLLMYLEPERVAALLMDVNRFFTGELALAITFMVPDARGRRRFQNGSVALDVWLSLVGEPFLSAFTHAELSRTLEQNGFSNLEFWDERRLKAEVVPQELRTMPIAVGEHVCVGRR